MQRMVLRELGKDWRHVESSDLTLDDREPAAPSSTVDEESDAIPMNPRVDALHAALGALSPSLRDVVRLHGLEGHTHEETARILGIEPTAVRVRWHRAKHELRRLLVGEVRVAC
jgi:RNA polymerase sigma-70 factor (ECF subfamily)